MARVSSMGGGGCPAYDILVEDLPFDFLQPPMQRGLTQAGYGGPFVVRNNPIGAVFDAIRSFCFPAPMQASSDGTQYAGSGLDTYGGFTSQDLGSLGGGYSGFGPYAPPATNMSGYPACAGQMPDYSTQMCVPLATPAGGNTPAAMSPDCTTSCDPSCLDYYSSLAASACTNYDSVTLGSIAVKAAGCSIAAGSNKQLQMSWAKLASDCTRWAQYIIAGKQCNGNPKPPMAPAGGTTGGGMTGGGTTGGGTTGGGTTGGGTTGGGTTGGGTPPPATGSPMGGNTGGPFGYIPASHPGTGSANVVKGYLIREGRLPDVPNPTSLTEGNPRLQPTAEPMGGAFDPARIEGGRLNRPRTFSQRMMGFRSSIV